MCSSSTPWSATEATQSFSHWELRKLGVLAEKKGEQESIESRMFRIAIVIGFRGHAVTGEQEAAQTECARKAKRNEQGQGAALIITCVRGSCGSFSAAVHAAAVDQHKIVP